MEGKFEQVWWECADPACNKGRPIQQLHPVEYCLAEHGPLHCGTPMKLMGRAPARPVMRDHATRGIGEIRDEIQNLRTENQFLISRIMKLENAERRRKVLEKPTLRS